METRSFTAGRRTMMSTRRQAFDTGFLAGIELVATKTRAGTLDDVVEEPYLLSVSEFLDERYREFVSEVEERSEHGSVEESLRTELRCYRGLREMFVAVVAAAGGSVSVDPMDVVRARETDLVREDDPVSGTVVFSVRSDGGAEVKESLRDASFVRDDDGHVRTSREPSGTRSEGSAGRLGPDLKPAHVNDREHERRR